MAFSQTVAIEMASASDNAGPAARGLSGALPGPRLIPPGGWSGDPAERLGGPVGKGLDGLVPTVYDKSNEKLR
jgi:hypothetical protein